MIVDKITVIQADGLAEDTEEHPYLHFQQFKKQTQED